MNARTVRRIAFPALALAIAAFAWWCERRPSEARRPVPRETAPAEPIPAPNDPAAPRIMSAPPKPTPGTAPRSEPSAAPDTPPAGR